MASLLVAVGMAAACSGGGAASGVGSPTGGSAGFRPTEGAGKHVHLDGGDGLTNSHSDSNHELGWDEDWADDVDLDRREPGL